MIGKKINNLTVIKEIERKKLPCGQYNRAFLCKCDCGNETEVRLLHLNRGSIKTCGCAGKDVKGESYSEIYKIYNSIRTRTKENYFERKHYFDKGIKVCEEWKNSFQTFKKFAIENGYKKGLTIDRINSNGNYEPNNVRFVTQKVNANNRHNTFMVEHNGQKKSLRLLVDELGVKIKFDTIYARIKRGYSFEEAVNIPIKNNYSGRFKD